MMNPGRRGHKLCKKTYFSLLTNQESKTDSIGDIKNIALARNCCGKK